MRGTFIRLGLLILCIIWAAPGATARRRAVAPSFFDTRHILWIAAHPDDEVIAAPLLGRLCVEGASTCSLLVLTRGERGLCRLPGGCSPDLGALRSAEMQSSAALLRATLTQWTLPDVTEDVAEAWAAASGGRTALLGAIAGVIEMEKPSVIVTFDPAHGTSCHRAHREVGALVLEAAGSTPVFLLETATELEEGAYRFRNALPGSHAIEASPWWSYLVQAARTHASQFTDDDVASLAATPAAQQRLFVMPAQTAPGAYAFSCAD